MPGQQAEPSLKPTVLANAEEAGPAAGASSDCHPTKGRHCSGPPLPEPGPSSQGQLDLPDVPATPGLGDAAVLQGEQQCTELPYSAPQQGLAASIQPVAVYVSAVPEVSDTVMACFMAGWHGGPSRATDPADVKSAGQVAPPHGQLRSGQVAGGGGAASGHPQQQSGASIGAVTAYEMRYAGNKKKSAGKRPGFR